MNFPIVVIKEGESPIYFFRGNDFGLVSKGGESFYKKGEAFDSDGKKYLIRGINSIDNASILISMRYFQPMKVVNMNLEAIDVVSLSKFKQIINDHIQLHKKYWVKKDLIYNLERTIMEKDSFAGIIKILR